MVSMKKVDQIIDNAMMLSMNNDEEALASVRAIKDTVYIIYGEKACNSNSNLMYLLQGLTYLENDVDRMVQRNSYLK